MLWLIYALVILALGENTEAACALCSVSTMQMGGSPTGLASAPGAPTAIYRRRTERAFAGIAAQNEISCLIVIFFRYSTKYAPRTGLAAILNTDGPSWSLLYICTVYRPPRLLHRSLQDTNGNGARL